MHRTVVASVVVSAVLFSLPSSAQEAQTLTVDQAVQRALEVNPGLQAARARQDASEDAARSVRGHFLPVIVASDEHQRYDQPYALAFALPGVPPGKAPSFKVRDLNTNTLVLAAAQPILGLLKLREGYVAADEFSAAGAEQVLSTESAVREAVETGFLRYFEAKSLIEIAKTSEQQLADQQKIAESKMAAGVLTKADLLRLQVAEANARQQEIQATTQAEIARTALLIALAYPPEERGIDFAEPKDLEERMAPGVDLQSAQSTAMSKRHEVLAALHQADAADHQKWAKAFTMLPDFNLEAAWVHLQGQAFAPENSYYVGFKASWNVFEWGATWFDYRASANQARAARLFVDQEAQNVRIDAATRLTQVQAAAEAMKVAQATIASAEEAYRVTDAAVKAGAATTTDLLDAQSALTQAKLNLVRARYEQALAIVAYTRASGG